MMGQVGPQDQLFYWLRFSDYIPEDHLMRQVDQFMDVTALCAELAPLYNLTDRPSIDPELMIRMLLVGYLHGIRSETSLCQKVHLNLAYRGVSHFDLGAKVPERSTFSKNCHGRFVEGDVMRRVFDFGVSACADNGLIGGTGALVDISTVHADANCARKPTPTRVEATWAASDGISRPAQEYLVSFEGNAPFAWPQTRTT